jgi:hypothetical protein
MQRRRAAIVGRPYAAARSARPRHRRGKSPAARIGSFSAASNVSGIVSDTEAIATVLHEHGALSFWDFAACAPYVEIEMNGPGTSYKDALVISPHKFIGGPGTPGVLAIRRELMTNPVPVVPGGGTVLYVNPTEHRYFADPAHREEGGTPAIVEPIRATTAPPGALAGYLVEARALLAATDAPISWGTAIVTRTSAGQLKSWDPQSSSGPRPGGHANSAEPVCSMYSLRASWPGRVPAASGRTAVCASRMKAMKNRPASRWPWPSEPSVKL